MTLGTPLYELAEDDALAWAMNIAVKKCKVDPADINAVLVDVHEEGRARVADSASRRLGRAQALSTLASTCRVLLS